MLEIYSYEYVRAANEERRTRALNRYERLRRGVDQSEPTTSTGEAEIVEIVFPDGCHEPDQISA